MRVAFVDDSCTNGSPDDRCLRWPGRVVAASTASTRWRCAVELGDGRQPNAGGYGALAALIEAWPPRQARRDTP